MLPPTMENQMEKNMENDMETGVEGLGLLLRNSIKLP